MKKELKKHPCRTCGKETEFCSMCDGEDDYAMEGQYGGFYLCKDEDCEDYQYCCGC